MIKTILITDASKHGATAEFAKTIVETLTQTGIQTALAEAKTVGDFRDWDAITSWAKSISNAITEM